MDHDSNKTAYSRKDFHGLYPTGFELFFWNRFRTDKVYRLLRSFSPGKILDIGCGCGHIVKFLRDQGLEAEGCELSPDAEPCSPQIAPFYHPGVDACDLPSGERAKFRTLLLLDVLEHLEKPELFLRSLLEKFPNCRNILVTVPAFMELWNDYADQTHFLRYTKASFDILLEQLPELKKVRSGYFFHSLYPVKLLIKNSEKSNRVKPVFGLLHKTVNSCAYYFFKIEDALIPECCAGSSLFELIEVKKAEE